MREERAVEAARRIMTGCEDPLEATIVARAYLALSPDDAREAAHEIISDLLSMCDVSNWDADGYRGLEYSIRHEVYERLHDFAADWQQRIGALRAVERPADPRGWQDAIEAAAKVCDTRSMEAAAISHTARNEIEADHYTHKAVEASFCADAIRSLSPAPKDRAPTSASILIQVELGEIISRMRKYAPSLRGVGMTASDASYNRTLRDAKYLEDLAQELRANAEPPAPKDREGTKDD